MNRTTTASAFQLLAIGLLSVTLSSNNIDLSVKSTEMRSLDPSAISQTISASQHDSDASKYYLEMKSPKEEAFMLFGEQQNYSEAEQELYWKVIEAKSIKTGININALF